MKFHRNITNILNYKFQNQNLLEQALTHRSFSEEHNERLEFLGDAVLTVITSEWLYARHPVLNEGELTRARASLVRKSSLYEYANCINLAEYIRLGAGEEAASYELVPSILADAFEALWGAVFLDAGYVQAKTLFLAHFQDRLIEQLEKAVKKDSKTALQEFAQKQYSCLPEYSTLEETGADHLKTFKILCSLKNYVGIGMGNSKKEAQSEAAQRVLDQIGEHHV